MSNYLADCTPDEGLDYIFGRMAATYGASFMRHWDGVDPNLVRNVWKDDVGIYLTSRESMDYALKHMHPDFPPSSISFAKQCLSGPPMKKKPVVMIENTLTEAEKVELRLKKEKALRDLAALRKSFAP